MRPRGVSCSRWPGWATCAPTADCSRYAPRVLELGYAYLSSLSLPEAAQPHLEELVAQVHESSSVSVLDRDEVVYVARFSTRRA